MKIPIAFLSAFFLAGCMPGLTQTSKVSKTYDEFDHRLIVYTFGNQIASFSSGFYGTSLDAQFVKTDSAQSYFLSVFYRNADWLFIQPGASLTLLIDGEKLNLSTPDVRREVISYGVYEEADYLTDVDLIAKIVRSKDAKIKIQGKNAYISGTVELQNRAQFVAFLDSVSVITGQAITSSRGDTLAEPSRRR